MREGWNNATLGDVLALIRNGTNCEQTKVAGGVRISRIETIASSAVNPDKVGYAILTDNQKTNFKLSVGDILFSHINSAAHVGKTAIVKHDYDIYHGINLLLFRTKDEINSDYLQYYLILLYRTGYWRGVCKQSVNQASVNQTDIKKVPISYPKSLREQRRIVAILNDAFERISTAIAHAEKNLLNSRGLFINYLNSVFLEKGNGWVETTVAELVVNGVLSKPLDGNHGEIHPKRADFVSSGVPFIMASDLIEGEVDQENCNFLSLKQASTLRTGFAKGGDILLSHKGTIGRAAILYTKQEFVMLTPQVTYYRVKDDSKLHNLFLFYLFQTAEFQRQLLSYANEGTTRAYIGITKQLKLRICYPCIDKQKELVKEFEALATHSRSLETVYHQKLAALAELKQAILQKAFAGELTARSAEAVQEAAE